MLTFERRWEERRLELFHQRGGPIPIEELINIPQTFIDHDNSDLFVLQLIH